MVCCYDVGVWLVVICGFDFGTYWCCDLVGCLVFGCFWFGVLDLLCWLVVVACLFGLWFIGGFWLVLVIFCFVALGFMFVFELLFVGWLVLSLLAVG